MAKRKSVSKKSDPAPITYAPLFYPCNFSSQTKRAKAFTNLFNEVENTRKQNDLMQSLQQKFPEFDFNTLYFLFKHNGIGYSFEIDIDEAPKFFNAYDINSGEKIADLILYGTGEAWLDSIKVNEQKQHQGIATILLRLALFFYPKLQVPDGFTKRDNTACYFTDSGQAWANRCFDKGILSRKINCGGSMPVENRMVYHSSFE